MKKLILFSLGILLISCDTKKPDAANSPEKITQSEKSESWRNELQKYDSEIRKKTNQQNLHLAKAARAQDQGDRLQFQQGNLLDARRYWQISDYHKEQAQILEKEIQLLQLEKQKLLKEHGVNPEEASA
jgi:hypothetical protein